MEALNKESMQIGVSILGIPGQISMLGGKADSFYSLDAFAKNLGLNTYEGAAATAGRSNIMHISTQECLTSLP